jgi:hypothetical protein
MNADRNKRQPTPWDMLDYISNDFVFNLLFICKTLETLKIDTVYRSEYETFVASMNYGNKKISFDDAINLYEKICNQILVNLP